MRYRKAGPAQPPYAGNFLLGVIDLPGVDGLLRLKDGIDAFRRNDGLAFIVKDERRILAVKLDNVDLVAECPLAIDDMRRCRLITLRQVSLKELKPDALARVALCAGVAERLSCGRQTPLDVVVQAGEKLGKDQSVI